MDVSFGQYYPSNSFVHKCDPRTKFLFLVLYIVLIFIAQNFYALGLCALVFVLSVCLSGVPIKSVLKSVKGILFLLIFTALLNLLFRFNGEEEKVLVDWWIFTITKEGLIQTAFLAVRLILLVTSSALLTLTTTPVSLTDGVESLLSPLKLVRFPVHAIALVMSIALRFIPILTDETARIMNAQKSRGADFENGSIFKRIKAIIPVLFPLLVSALHRAAELSDAMDARCYMGGKKRTKYKKLRFTWRDGVVLAFSVLFLAGSILIRIFL